MEYAQHKCSKVPWNRSVKTYEGAWHLCGQLAPEPIDHCPYCGVKLELESSEGDELARLRGIEKALLAGIPGEGIKGVTAYLWGLHANESDPFWRVYISGVIRALEKKPEPEEEEKSLGIDVEPLSHTPEGWLELLHDVERNIAQGFLPTATQGIRNLMCSIRIAEKNVKQRELVPDLMMVKLSRALLEDWDIRLRIIVSCLIAGDKPLRDIQSDVLSIASHMRALLNC